MTYTLEGTGIAEVAAYVATQQAIADQLGGEFTEGSEEQKVLVFDVPGNQFAFIIEGNRRELLTLLDKARDWVTREIPPGKVKIRVINTYEDGHTSTQHYDVVEPDRFDDLEQWWEDEVFHHTGDGHGVDNPKLGSMHEVTIVGGPAELLGKEMEW